MIPEDYFDCPGCGGGFCGPGPVCDTCNVLVTPADHERAQAVWGKLRSVSVLANVLAVYRTEWLKKAKLPVDSQGEVTRLRRLYAELDAQIKALAAFIVEAIPGEPSRDEGACETAIRLLRERATQLHPDDEAFCRQLEGRDGIPIGTTVDGIPIGTTVGPTGSRLLEIIRKHHPRLKSREERWAERILACVNSNKRDAKDDLYNIAEELRAAAAER